MAEIQPMLTRIPPFDSTKGTSIYFIYTGSQQLVASNLVIREKLTGLVVYSFDFVGYEKVHHLPPSVIQNGKRFVAKVRVKFADNTYSTYSNEVEFDAVKTPVLDIENIDGQGYVYNSDVTFITRYSQDDSEKVKTYRYHLYDESEDLLQSFPIRIPLDVAGIVLTETVPKLEKGKGYFIECTIETEKGFIWSQREKFIPLYMVPSLNGVIQTRSDEEEGFVRITANIKQLLGTQVRATDESDTYISDNYQYENEEWVIVPSDNPIVFKGMSMNRASDFVMKVWCKDVPIGTKFLEISPKTGEGIPIEFWRHANRIVAKKGLAGLTSSYVSNIINVPLNSSFMLYARVIEHRIELELKIL